jgi:hypothetical protein
MKSHIIYLCMKSHTISLCMKSRTIFLRMKSRTIFLRMKSHTISLRRCGRQRSSPQSGGADGGHARLETPATVVPRQERTHYQEILHRGQWSGCVYNNVHISIGYIYNFKITKKSYTEVSGVWSVCTVYIISAFLQILWAIHCIQFLHIGWGGAWNDL